MLRARITLPGMQSTAPNDDIASLLDCLSDIWARWLRGRRDFPPLYRSGVVYAPEIDTEDWLSPEQILAAGKGDCEDLTLWRCAELRSLNVDAVPQCTSRMVGRRFVQHVFVLLPSGKQEDPSLLLMPQGVSVRR
jgi:hypothetical protein